MCDSKCSTFLFPSCCWNHGHRVTCTQQIASHANMTAKLHQNRPSWEWGSSASCCSSYFPHPSPHLSAHHADKSHYESGKPLNPYPQRDCRTSPRLTPTFQNWVSRCCWVFLRQESHLTPSLHRGLWVYTVEDHLDTSSQHCGWRSDGIDQCSVTIVYTKTTCVCLHLLYQQISASWQQL